MTTERSPSQSNTAPRADNRLLDSSMKARIVWLRLFVVIQQYWLSGSFVHISILFFFLSGKVFWGGTFGVGDTKEQFKRTDSYIKLIKTLMIQSDHRLWLHSKNIWASLVSSSGQMRYRTILAYCLALFYESWLEYSLNAGYLSLMHCLWELYSFHRSY